MVEVPIARGSDQISLPLLPVPLWQDSFRLWGRRTFAFAVRVVDAGEKRDRYEIGRCEEVVSEAVGRRQYRGRWELMVGDEEKRWWMEEDSGEREQRVVRKLRKFRCCLRECCFSDFLAWKNLAMNATIFGSFTCTGA